MGVENNETNIPPATEITKEQGDTQPSTEQTHEDDQLYITQVASDIVKLASSFKKKNPEKVEKLGINKMFELTEKLVFTELEKQGESLSTEQKLAVKSILEDFKRSVESTGQKAKRAENVTRMLDENSGNNKEIARIMVADAFNNGMDLSKPLNLNYNGESINTKLSGDHIIADFDNQTFKFKISDIESYIPKENI